MLDKTLQRLIEERHTSAREIGELAGVSTSTVYRWIAGESQPDFHSIRLLLRHMPHPLAQEAILTAFAAGTCWQFSRHDMDLDVNADGRVDVEDALDASVAAVKASADSLERVREACHSGQLDAEDTLRLIATLNHAVCQCTLTQRVLVELGEKRQRKLKLAK